MIFGISFAVIGAFIGGGFCGYLYGAHVASKVTGVLSAMSSKVDIIHKIVSKV